MDLLDKIISGFSNTSDPLIYYAGFGISLIIALIFFRKVLYALIIVTGLAVICLVFSYFTGYKLPLGPLQDINPESFISDTRSKLDSLLGDSPKSPAPKPEETENTEL
ncbi:MAG: hypothetical protein K0R98_919 [Rickettsiaceae bacterium]|jgi:hypothetical protein|nr:hypothetical protein [Rickettsiaceae bacterium]